MSVQEHPTPLNFKRLTIEVSDSITKDGGLFSASYISYKVRTDPLSYEVRRKDTDFAILRKVLVKQFPHIVVPPCNLNVPTKFVPKIIERREKYYTRFLQAIGRSEELKSSQFLLDFLFEADHKAWAKSLKDTERIKGPRTLEEYSTLNGQARVQASAAGTQFCLKMLDYADSYKILYTEMLDSAA